MTSQLRPARADTGSGRPIFPSTLEADPIGFRGSAMARKVWQREGLGERGDVDRIGAGSGRARCAWNRHNAVPRAFYREDFCILATQSYLTPCWIATSSVPPAWTPTCLSAVANHPAYVPPSRNATGNPHHPLERAMSSMRKGFTLIELLIVVVIIGILAAIAIPKFASTKEKAYLASEKSDLRNLATSEEAYFSGNQTYTTDQSAMNFTTSQGVTIGWHGRRCEGLEGYVERIARRPSSATPALVARPLRRPSTVSSPAIRDPLGWISPDRTRIDGAPLEMSGALFVPAPCHRRSPRASRLCRASRRWAPTSRLRAVRTRARPLRDRRRRHARRVADRRIGSIAQRTAPIPHRRRFR